MYEVCREIDFKKIKRHQFLKKIAYAFLAGYGIIITILLEL